MISLSVFLDLFISSVTVLCSCCLSSGRHVGGSDEAELSGVVSGVCLQAAGDTGEEEVWVCRTCECLTFCPDCHSTRFISTLFAVLFANRQHLICSHLSQKKKVNTFTEIHSMQHQQNIINKYNYNNLLKWNKIILLQICISVYTYTPFHKYRHNTSRCCVQYLHHWQHQTL